MEDPGYGKTLVLAVVRGLRERGWSAGEIEALMWLSRVRDDLGEALDRLGREYVARV